MLFSGGMAGFLALSTFIMAAVVYRAGHPPRLAVAIAYFGLMDALQAVQYHYMAVPDDNYAMCNNGMNRFLTVLGGLQICFQPFFFNMALTAMARRKSFKARCQDDVILRLCVLGGIWLVVRFYLGANKLYEIADRPSSQCPNYEWFRDGYDAGNGFDLPNPNGNSCTFKSNTPTGHLAWAFPLYQATYFVPGVSIHSFLMFVPTLVVKQYSMQTFILLLTGPVLAMFLTSSVSEQASIWFYLGAFQCLFICLTAFFVHPQEATDEVEIVHSGGIGERAVTYSLLSSTTETNGHHSNGKKVY